MTALSLALRNLAGFHPRSLATIGGIMIAVASLVALVGLARGVASTLLDSLDARGADVVVTEAGNVDLMSSILPQDLVARALAVEGVAAAAPELARMTTLADGRSVVVVGWPADSFAWRGHDLQGGRLPGAGDGTVAILGQALAERGGLGLGDRLELFQTEFTVAGLVDAPSLLARNLIYVPLPAMQDLTFRDGLATSILVQLRPGRPEARAAAVERLRLALADYSVAPSERLVQQYSYGRIAEVLSLSISAVALLSAVLVIFNTMSMSVSERRGEIAIMAAVGWARWRIVAVLVGEAVALSLVAGLLGSALGVAVAHGVAHSPAAAGFIDPRITVGLVVSAIALSGVIGVVGALAPALAATARSPAAVLRGR
jgi:putative ABC transport system permease protein